MNIEELNRRLSKFNHETDDKLTTATDGNDDLIMEVAKQRAPLGAVAMQLEPVGTVAGLISFGMLIGRVLNEDKTSLEDLKDLEW